MRISDWSSDVCSSDLLAGTLLRTLDAGAESAAVWKTANRALGHSGPVAEAFLNRNELELVVEELLTLAQGLRPLLLIGRVGAPDGTLVAFFEPEAVRHIVVVETHQARSEEHKSELQSIIR